MIENIQQALQTDIFWYALSALATLLSAVIALLLPFLIPALRLKRLVRMVRSEIDNNAKCVRTILSSEPPQIPNIGTLKKSNYFNALAKNIKLTLWLQYRFELASEKPDVYEKYQTINQHAEWILNNTPLASEADAIIFEYEANQFLQDYNKVFS